MALALIRFLILSLSALIPRYPRSVLCGDQFFLLHNVLNLASDRLGNTFAVLRVALVEVTDLQVLDTLLHLTIQTAFASGRAKSYEKRYIAILRLLRANHLSPFAQNKAGLNCYDLVGKYKLPRLKAALE